MKLFSYISFTLKNLSYAKKLFWSYFAFIFIPLISLSAFFYTNLYLSQKNQLIHLNQLYIQQTTSALESRTNEMLTLAKSLAMQTDLRSCLEKNPADTPILEQAADLNQMEILINSCYHDAGMYDVRFYVNPDFAYSKTEVITWSLSEIDSHFPGCSPKIMKGPMLHGPLQLHVELLTYKPVFSLTMPIYGTKNYNQPVGLICIDISQSDILNTLKTALFSQTGEVFLTDADGRPLAGYSAAGEAAIPQEELTGSFDVSQDYVLKNHTLTVISPLIEKNWHVAVCSSIDPVSASAVFPVFILITLSIGAIVCLLGRIYAHFNSKRIIALSDTVKQITQGDFTHRCIVDSIDEIGDLQTSINEMTEKIQNLMEKEYHMGMQLKNSELRLLQAQINPHFLYNTLNVIKWAAQNKKSEEVSDIIDKLSRYYRLGLSNGMEFVTIKDELEHASLYVQLQNKRFHDNVHLQIVASPAVYGYRLLKLLLQPLIENSVVHGLENRQGTITICIEEETDFLSITVTDDGAGISHEKLSSIRLRLELGIESSNPSGYGLTNIQERLIHHYGPKSGLNISSCLGGGTAVKIRLPLEKL